MSCILKRLRRLDDNQRRLLLEQAVLLLLQRRNLGAIVAQFGPSCRPHEVRHIVPHWKGLVVHCDRFRLRVLHNVLQSHLGVGTFRELLHAFNASLELVLAGAQIVAVTSSLGQG